MTTEEVKKAADIMLAFADGVEIQYSHKGQNNWLNWINESSPSFDWQTFDYRIKSEPKYRPFKTQEECWDEMHKHPDFGFIREKGTKVIYSIAMIDNFYLSTQDKSEHLCDTMDVYEFLDGTPFGIKEE